jgi:hypothetical protein
MIGRQYPVKQFCLRYHIVKVEQGGLVHVFNVLAARCAGWVRYNQAAVIVGGEMVALVVQLNATMTEGF